MRCKACNSVIPVTYRNVPGCEHPILEDLCSTCLFAVRGYPRTLSEADAFILEIGIPHVPQTPAEEV